MILIVTVVVGALAILAEVLWSSWRGRRLYGFGDTLTNLSATGVEHVFTILVAVPVYELYAAAFRHRVVTCPSWIALPLALVLLDFGFYTWHRASHRIGLLWFGHSIHHSSEEFNFSVAVRSSGWARLTQRFFYLPLAIVGIPVGTMVLADAITTIYALFLHNRFVPKLGWLEKVLVTPSHHRVHHARNPEYLDKNFAAMFIFWDHLFGTHAEEHAEPVFGLTTPLHTHNIAWARFHVLFEIADRMRRASGLGQKLLAPLCPPDWDPDARAKPKPLAVHQPMPTPARGVRRAYALLQHVALFVAIFAFTFFAPDLALGPRIAVALWLCGSLAVVGALLDARRWAVYLEPVRWIIALAALVHASVA
jgi:sterol desaturase/sphingolipid hydroxylase (fatty acid hydroxylase superfamily)